MKRTRSTKPYAYKPYKKARYTYQPRTAVSRYSPQTQAFRPHPSAIEKKVNDLVTATYQVNTSGSFTLLANPTLGSDFNNRIGRKVLLKSLYVRGRIGTEPALSGVEAIVPAQQARMILFVDLQPNGAAPAVTDLLVEALPTSQLNLNNRDRFMILCDKQYCFDPYYLVTSTATQTLASCNRQIYNIKKYKKLNQEMIFNGTNGGTIADITSGALYMFWIGNKAASATDANAVLSTRVRYVDA